MDYDLCKVRARVLWFGLEKKTDCTSWLNWNRSIMYSMVASIAAQKRESCRSVAAILVRRRIGFVCTLHLTHYTAAGLMEGLYQDGYTHQINIDISVRACGVLWRGVFTCSCAPLAGSRHRSHEIQIRLPPLADIPVCESPLLCDPAMHTAIINIGEDMRNDVSFSSGDGRTADRFPGRVL